MILICLTMLMDPIISTSDAVNRSFPAFSPKVNLKKAQKPDLDCISTKPYRREEYQAIDDRMAHIIADPTYGPAAICNMTTWQFYRNCGIV